MAASGMSGSNDAPVLLFLLLIFYIVLRRAIAMARGTRVSVPRLALMAVVYVLLFALGVGEDLYYGLLPAWTLGPDLAVLVVGGALALVHVERTVHFFKGPGGTWMYRLGVALPAIYLALYVVRIVLELVVLGENPLAPTAPTSAFSLDQQLILGGVNLLFSLSLGFLLGRGAGVIRAFRRLPPETGPPAPVAAAPPLP